MLVVAALVVIVHLPEQVQERRMHFLGEVARLQAAAPFRKGQARALLERVEIIISREQNPHKT